MTEDSSHTPPTRDGWSFPKFFQIAGPVSFVGVFIFIGISVFRAEWHSDTWVLALYLLVLNVTLIALLVYASLQNRKELTQIHMLQRQLESDEQLAEKEVSELRSNLSREHQRREQTISRFRFASRKTNEVSGRLIGSFCALSSLDRGGNDVDEQSVDQIIREDIIYLVDNLRELCTQYTESECAVTLKLLEESPKADGDHEIVQQVVQTYVRDNITSGVRGRIDEWLSVFPYTHNSAFRTIVDDPDSNKYFLCNNLQRAHDNGDYMNANSKWIDHYSACSVVAVSNPRSIKPDDIIGFLCVDNTGGGFDTDVIVPVMFTFSYMIYLILEQYSRLTITTH